LVRAALTYFSMRIILSSGILGEKSPFKKQEVRISQSSLALDIARAIGAM